VCVTAIRWLERPRQKDASASSCRLSCLGSVGGREMLHVSASSSYIFRRGCNPQQRNIYHPGPGRISIYELLIIGMLTSPLRLADSLSKSIPPGSTFFWKKEHNPGDIPDIASVKRGSLEPPTTFHVYTQPTKEKMIGSVSFLPPTFLLAGAFFIILRPVRCFGPTTRLLLPTL